MYEFYSEVSDRKKTASGSRYMKRGSKSKKCPLPSDGMTQKQWKERNGKVSNYNFNKPMTFKEFKAAPLHIQTDYLQHLIKHYNVNAKSLCQMFGVTPATIRRYIDDNQIEVLFKVGNSMTKSQKESWAEFLSEQPNVQEAQESSATTSIMDSFSMSFTGKIDCFMIANSISAMLGAESTGRIEVNYYCV